MSTTTTMKTTQDTNTAPSATETSGLDARVLELLVCPLTKTTLHYDRDAQELVSEQAGLAFPVRGGIPILLVEEARRH